MAALSVVRLETAARNREIPNLRALVRQRERALAGDIVHDLDAVAGFADDDDRRVKGEIRLLVRAVRNYDLYGLCTGGDRYLRLLDRIGNRSERGFHRAVALRRRC